MKDPRINFYLVKRNLKSRIEIENHRLLMSVCFPGSRVIYYPGVTARINEWDKEKSEFNLFRENYIALNTLMKKLKENAVSIYKSLLYKDGAVNPIFFRQQLERLKITPGLGFFDCYLLFLETNYDLWSHSSYLKCKSLYKHLLDFNSTYSAKISLEGIDKKFLGQFVVFLNNKGLNYYTIKGYLNVFMWFLNWCFKENYMISSSYRGYRLELKRENDINNQYPDLIFLNFEELLRFMNFRFEDRKLEQVRDMFCFLAFTGMNFSELKALKKTDVFYEEIKISSKHPRIMPHNKFSLEIRDRYKNKFFLNNNFMPVYSFITVNKYLRLAIRDAGIKRMVFTSNKSEENISSVITISAANNTFVANCIQMGIPVEIAAKWSGKNSEKLYDHINNQLKQKESEALILLEKSYDKNTQ